MHAETRLHACHADYMQDDTTFTQDRGVCVCNGETVRKETVNEHRVVDGDSRSYRLHPSTRVRRLLTSLFTLLVIYLSTSSNQVESTQFIYIQ